jgi:hypothetical protein
MTAPGDGFEYGDDQVTARLSVEIPPEAIRSLDDVAQRTEDIRVNMEAVAKATADYGDYLTNIPALGQEADARQGSFVARNVDRLVNYEPSGLPDWQKNAGQQQLGDLAERDPRQFANVMAQRGNDPEWEDQSRVIDRGDSPLPPPRSRRVTGGGPTRDDTDWLSVLQENQEKTTGTITAILGELALGGRSNALQTANSVAGRAIPGLSNFQQQMQAQVQDVEHENNQMIQQYAEQNGVDVDTAAATLQGAGALKGAGMSSLLSGGSGMLLKGAGAVGLAAGAYAGVQKIGNQYQDFRSQGLERGGGAAEGMGFEMGVRTMAMNPFIDVEQSRKIMQTALNEGYTGQEMETVTQFMTENLLQMNLTAQESAKVLQENVLKGGQELASAQQDAMAATLMAQNENAMKTSGEFQQDWQSATATGIKAGAGGYESSQTALLATSMFAENPVLGDLAGQIVPGMANNPAMGMALGQASGYRGSPGGAFAYITSQAGGDKKAMMIWAQQIESLARRLAPTFASEQTKHQGLQQFMAMLKAQVGLDLGGDFTVAEELAGMALNGDLVREVERSSDERDRTLTGGEVERTGFLGSSGRNLRALGNTVSAGFIGLGGGLAGMFGDTEAKDELTGMRNRAWNRATTHRELGSDDTFSNARIEQLMQRHGASNIRVQDGDEEGRLDVSNEDQIRNIVSGRAKISVGGGEWTTLKDNSIMDGVGDTSLGGGRFDLTEDAKKLLYLIPDDVRSQHQKNVDANVRGYNANQPPPGENPGAIGGR